MIVIVMGVMVPWAQSGLQLSESASPQPEAWVRFQTFQWRSLSWLFISSDRPRPVGSITPYGGPNGGRMISTGSGPEGAAESAAATGVAAFETGAVEVAAGLMADIRLCEVPGWAIAAGL